MKYRNKPRVIEAVQFKGLGWYEANNEPYPDGHCECDAVDNGGGSPHSHVHTIHKGQTVKLEVGDWIITEPDGEHFYPCKPDIFEQTYEAVEGEPS